MIALRGVPTSASGVSKRETPLRRGWGRDAVGVQGCSTEVAAGRLRDHPARERLLWNRNRHDVVHERRLGQARDRNRRPTRPLIGQVDVDRRRVTLEWTTYKSSTTRYDFSSRTPRSGSRPCEPPGSRRSRRGTGSPCGNHGAGRSNRPSRRIHSGEPPAPSSRQACHLVLRERPA